jgi:hypothetical protein
MMKPDLEIIMSMLWHLNVLACYTIEKTSPLWSPDATVVASETFLISTARRALALERKYQRPSRPDATQ